MPGVCCTHFEGGDCQAIQGHCADGCAWEEAAWERLTAYEDTGLEPERVAELAQAEKDGRLVVPPSNDPLTLEELRKMDGEPVWVVPLNDFEILPANYLVNAYAEQIVVDKFGAYLDFEDYGKTWQAYRRRPVGKEMES